MKTLILVALYSHNRFIELYKQSEAEYDETPYFYATLGHFHTYNSIANRYGNDERTVRLRTTTKASKDLTSLLVQVNTIMREEGYILENIDTDLSLLQLHQEIEIEQ